MDIFQLLHNVIFTHTLRTIVIGTMLLGMIGGIFGCFAVLRRQALLGETMSHAALPGIVIAFVIAGGRAPLLLLLGATVAGWLAALLIMSVVHTTRIKEDSMLALILSVFFGTGMVLLTFVQRQPYMRQAGIDRFLFGQAAAMLRQDLVTMAVIGSVMLLLLLLFWKEFKLISFDPQFGATQSFPIRWIEIGLTTLVVIAVVVGLQTVGVVLMSAMLIAPATAARQWTNRLSLMVILAGGFGAFSGAVGSIISATRRGLATGPLIVLTMSVIVLISLLFAPNRGLFWNWLRHQRQRHHASRRYASYAFAGEALLAGYAQPIEPRHALQSPPWTGGPGGGAEHEQPAHEEATEATPPQRLSQNWE